MKKKLLAVLLSTAMMTGLLAGCGGGGNDSASDSAPAEKQDTQAGAEKQQESEPAQAETGTEFESQASGDGSKVVKFALSDSSKGGLTWQQEIVDKFEEETGYTVEVTLIPTNQDMYSKIMMLMTSEETCPDVIAEDGFMINSDAAAGRLMALDDALADWEDLDKFDPAILEGGRGTDGKLYGVMCSTDTQIVYYNKDLFKEIGIEGDWQPKNWDELMDAAKQLKEANADVEDFVPMWLWASQTFPEETSMRTFQHFLSGTEGEWPEQIYDTATGNWVVDREKLLEVLNFVNDAFNTYQVTQTPAQASDLSMGDQIVSDYMQNNKIGIYITGSWTLGQFQEGSAFPWAEAEEHWGQATLPTNNGQAPGMTTVSGGWSWAIPAMAPNKEGAVEFLKALCSYEGISARVIYQGETSPRTDVAESEEYKNQHPSSLVYSGSQLPYTHFRPSVDGYSSVTVAFTKMVEDVAFGAATPDEAIDGLQAEMIRLFGEDKVTVK